MTANPRYEKMPRFMAAYEHLEQSVQERMARLCGSFCAVCVGPCCRSVFCRETLESPFLSAVSRHFSPAPRWDKERGWLTDSGCALTAGRPPVCYSFYCSTIANAQTSPVALYALAVLSGLMIYAGRNASGSRHLVELADLNRLNYDRLAKQVVTAMRVLDHLIRYWKNPASVNLDMNLCEVICRPSSAIKPLIGKP